MLAMYTLYYENIFQEYEGSKSLKFKNNLRIMRGSNFLKTRKQNTFDFHAIRFVSVLLLLCFCDDVTY